MVVGHHLIWTAYGWWLPNDPRGSSSREIRVEPVAQLGELHYGRKETQPTQDELREFYQRARPVLAHAVLAFDEADVAVIAECFARTIRRRGYTCYACAIMLDHVHLLIRRHREMGDQMIEAFQNDSRAALIAAGRRPDNHPVWTRKGRAVYKNTREEMEVPVEYVEGNPREAGRPAQHYDFVKPYDGWLPGGAAR